MKTKRQKTRTRRRYMFFIIGILIVAAIAYRTCGKKDYDSFFSHDRLQMDKTLSLPIETDCPITLNWYPGARQMYQLNIIKTDYTYPSALESQSTESDNEYALQIHMDITGILNIRLFEQDEALDIQNTDLIYMGCQMSPVAVQVGETADTMRRDRDLEAFFKNFFLVAMRPDGLPETFYFPSKLDSQSRMSLSEIIFSVQTYVPQFENHPHPKKWRSDEQHAFGMLKVEYMVEPHNCTTLIKQNVRCTALHDLDRTMLKTDQFQFRGILEQSNNHITVHGNGASWIESYTGEETFAIFASQHAVWYRRHTKVFMTPDQQQPDTNLFIWKTTTPVHELINTFVSHKKLEPKQAPSKKKPKYSDRLSLSGQLEMFQKDVAANVEQDIILRHIQRLKHFLTKFPEEASFIPDLIKNLNIQGSTAEHVILILEMVGHEEAQNAISDIFLDYNQEPDTRLKAAISAGGISSPTSASIDRLFQLVSQEQQKMDADTLNRSDAAILSLGLLNQTLYLQQDMDQAKKLHERLTALLKGYLDERHMIACITAVGNAKMPEGADYLLPYLDSNSELIRTCVIKAMGNLDVAPGEDKEEIFTETEPESLTENDQAVSDGLSSNISMKLILQLSKENNPQIRRDIYDAILKRKEPEILDRLDDILHEEPDGQLRDMIRERMTGKIDE
ncbi:MAG: hypothetical protein HQK75_05740 [Candidatus Magnetomorum sp.]|nr:hypothetical protein [Candidatus Magnetomorum sp.]